MTIPNSPKIEPESNIVRFFDGVVRIRQKATLLKNTNRSGSSSYYAFMGTNSKGLPVRKSLGTNITQAEGTLREINIRIAAGRMSDAVNAFETAIDFDIKAAIKRLEGYGSSLPEAVSFFIKHHNPRSGIVSVDEAAERFFEKLTREGKAQSYIDSMRQNYVYPFIKTFSGRRLIDISQTDAENYIFKTKSNINSRQKGYHISHLSVFCNHLVQMGYLSPELNHFQKIQKPQVRSDDQTHLSDQDRILPVETVQSLISHAENTNNHQLLAGMVLVLFCGVRVEETMRLRWQDIKFKNKGVKIDIPQFKAKKRHRRVIDAPANVESWLRLTNHCSDDREYILTKRQRNRNGAISPVVFGTKVEEVGMVYFSRCGAMYERHSSK
jgi:site-specific recombinase XerC